MQEAVNPFRVPDQPPTRLLGLAHFDYPMQPHHAAMLTERLPLADSGDEHVLLFNVTSGFSFDSVFGGAGRLELWIRRSDLSALRFDHVVSFLHSS
jgi:hypothetical protein